MSGMSYTRGVLVETEVHLGTSTSILSKHGPGFCAQIIYQGRKPP
jgi:hypothetical protein